jgi:hypothetical protein
VSSNKEKESFDEVALVEAVCAEVLALSLDSWFRDSFHSTNHGNIVSVHQTNCLSISIDPAIVRTLQLFTKAADSSSGLAFLGNLAPFQKSTVVKRFRSFKVFMPTMRLCAIRFRKSSSPLIVQFLPFV